MIVITGAAGFIGSCLLGKLNEEGIHDILLVDDFSAANKHKNFEKKKFTEKIDRIDFPEWLKKHYSDVHFIFHIGARTDTTEWNIDLLNELNLNYSKTIWQLATQFEIPLVYASSAATYGSGEMGYEDKHELIKHLQPLNPYGISKNEFDKWVLQQTQHPPFWIGLKFFNVYGPNEYHKGRMASVIFHAFKQIEETGIIKLFRSHNIHYKDGEQLRDFIYVKDVVEGCCFFMKHQQNSGIYNIGTGKARTFLDLAKAVFVALGKKSSITFIDTPKDIREKYQYFTEAKMDKLKSMGYTKTFFCLEEGIMDYVTHYLIYRKHY